MNNFHKKTAYEMAMDLKSLLDAQPVIKFTDLQPGGVYHYKNGSGESAATVLRMLPSKKMADVLLYGDSKPRRITPTKFYGTFRLLSDELRKWLGVTHEAVVDKAIADGLEIPARVRVYYPDKFIELPERFDVKRLRDTLRPSWGRAMTTEAIDAMIEQRHQSIRKLDIELPKVTALNPDHVKDYERYLADWNTDLDFYRWLRPHVDAGGVFDLNGEKP